MNRYDPVISHALRITVYAIGAGAAFTLLLLVVMVSR